MQFNDGRPMFVYIDNNKIVDYVSLELNESNSCELNNLAVLPEFRYKGYGKELVAFAIDKARELECNKITLGIIEENTKLKNWYIDLGFIHIGTKEFEHLPFTVGFMEMEL